mmetsp:Transcript_10193/g.42285  ORF Transcript_10193/g.42285 Transcript_10193/m.42285 type:complete len:261 (-) Transcript_10193:1693-2475(-)
MRLPMMAAAAAVLASSTSLLVPFAPAPLTFCAGAEDLAFACVAAEAAAAAAAAAAIAFGATAAAISTAAAAAVDTLAACRAWRATHCDAAGAMVGAWPPDFKCAFADVTAKAGRDTFRRHELETSKPLPFEQRPDRSLAPATGTSSSRSTCLSPYRPTTVPQAPKGIDTLPVSESPPTKTTRSPRPIAPPAATVSALPFSGAHRSSLGLTFSTSTGGGSNGDCGMDASIAAMASSDASLTSRPTSLRRLTGWALTHFCAF